MRRGYIIYQCEHRTGHVSQQFDQWGDGTRHPDAASAISYQPGFGCESQDPILEFGLIAFGLDAGFIAAHRASSVLHAVRVRPPIP